jgi:hypothetical protein
VDVGINKKHEDTRHRGFVGTLTPSQLGRSTMFCSFTKKFSKIFNLIGSATGRELSVTSEASPPPSQLTAANKPNAIASTA